MADHLNPFAVESDLIENEIETDNKQPEREQTPENVSDIKVFTLDSIAAKLIKDNFVLTALELHTELLESGRELPRLRDYFSNPANFERTKLPGDLTSPNLRMYAHLNLEYAHWREKQSFWLPNHQSVHLYLPTFLLSFYPSIGHSGLKR